MNVLITGATGSLGQQILNQLLLDNNLSIYAPGHMVLDLLNYDKLLQYINDNHISYIINAAWRQNIYNQTTRDTKQYIYDNLLMFENITLAGKGCQKIIHFGSGSEYDVDRDICNAQEGDIYARIPTQFGGFVKNIIAKRIDNIRHPKSFNLKVFGVFGAFEEDRRFIKNSLLSIVKDKPIVIYQNKWFDYIYIDDLIAVVKHILYTDVQPTNINCVYKEKYTLLDIAQIMLNATKSNTNIIINDQNMGLCYTGNGDIVHRLQLPLVGLSGGIKKMYGELNGSC
jgi:GDP-L-fucose synthase